VDRFLAYVRALLDAITPPLCVLCRGYPGALPWLCESCAEELEFCAGACCLRCGASRHLPVPTCDRCPDWPRGVVAARSAAPHAGAARALVHALKYRSILAAAEPLAYFTIAAARQLNLPPDFVVVPIPLHRARRRQRGFNQAEEIARIVARELGVPHRPRWLRRIRHEIASVYRTPAGRKRAVRGAFRASAAVRNRAVLLIDDVTTTGATAGAAARALTRKGVGDIYLVTATRSR